MKKNRVADFKITGKVLNRKFLSKSWAKLSKICVRIGLNPKTSPNKKILQWLKLTMPKKTYCLHEPPEMSTIVITARSCKTLNRKWLKPKFRQSSKRWWVRDRATSSPDMSTIGTINLWAVRRKTSQKRTICRSFQRSKLVSCKEFPLKLLHPKIAPQCWPQTSKKAWVLWRVQLMVELPVYRTTNSKKIICPCRRLSANWKTNTRTPNLKKALDKHL